MCPSAGCRCREGRDWHGSRSGATQLDRVERIEFRVEGLGRVAVPLLLSWMWFYSRVCHYFLDRGITPVLVVHCIPWG
jgi:hypothetical protein